MDFFSHLLRRTGLNYRDLEGLYGSFNETIRQVAQQNQIPVIDLARKIPPNQTYIFDPVHLNDTGSKYAASLIAAKLKSLI